MELFVMNILLTKKCIKLSIVNFKIWRWLFLLDKVVYISNKKYCSEIVVNKQQGSILAICLICLWFIKIIKINHK